MSTGTISILKESLDSQFGAAIGMLRNAIQSWPEEEWGSDKRAFYHSYHTLLFLDYYLTFPAKEMSSPLPFRIIDFDSRPQGLIDDLMPERNYSRNEILDYLDSCRVKCREVIESLTEEKLQTMRWQMEGRDFPILEMLLYNMRHVQHHAAQLNMILRQKIGDAPRWVSRSK